MDIELFSHQVVFKQKVKNLTGKDLVINGSVEYMVCDNQRCLPPTDEDFEFKVTTDKTAAAVKGDQSGNETAVSATEEKVTDTVAKAEDTRPAATIAQGNEMQQEEATDITTDKGKKKDPMGNIYYFFACRILRIAYSLCISHDTTYCFLFYARREIAGQGYY